jgi:hypothetical protein
MSDLWQRQIPGTDLEINWNLNGNDLVVRVNKGPTMVARVILRDAAKEMTPLSGQSGRGLSGQLGAPGNARRDGAQSVGRPR